MIKKYLHQMILLLLLSACSSSIASTPTDPITDPGPDECQDAVHVEVWADSNENGVFDADELPLSDVLIILVSQGDVSKVNIQQTTSEAGDVYFPTRELADCSAENYDVLFAREVEGYQFPVDPVVSLNNFAPDFDIVKFGLLPEPGN